MIGSSQPSTPAPRNLHLLWFAQSTSLVGLQTGSVAVPLLAVDVLHASASQVALIGTAAGVPWLVAPVVGVLCDRAGRKQLLVVSHLGRSLLWLAIPAAYLAGVLTLHQLMVVSALVGLLSVVFAVGYRTLLPSIVAETDLAAANGKMGGTDAAARAIGPAFAGYLVQLLGAVWTVLVQTVASLAAGVATAAIRTQPRPPAAPSEAPWPLPQARTRPAPGLDQWWRSIVEGFGYLYRIKPLRWLALCETGYLLFFDVAFAIVVVFFRHTLGLTAAIIGVVFSAGSVGGIVGATTANRLRMRFGFDSTVKAAAVLRGAGIALIPLSVLALDHGTVIALLITARAVNAYAWSVYEVLTDTFQQTVLPDHRRGSATAAGLWLGNIASTIGSAAAAVLATDIGATALLIAAGVGAAAASCICLLVRTEPDTCDAAVSRQRG